MRSLWGNSASVLLELVARHFMQEARIISGGIDQGSCQYPKTGVPPTAV
jgi:hypothetical protein